MKEFEAHRSFQTNPIIAMAPMSMVMAMKRVEVCLECVLA